MMNHVPDKCQFLANKHVVETFKTSMGIYCNDDKLFSLKVPNSGLILPLFVTQSKFSIVLSQNNWIFVQRKQ